VKPLQELQGFGATLRGGTCPVAQEGTHQDVVHRIEIIEKFSALKDDAHQISPHLGTLPRGKRVKISVRDAHVPRSRGAESDHGVQQRRLPAAARADDGGRPTRFQDERDVTSKKSFSYRKFEAFND